MNDDLALISKILNDGSNLREALNEGVRPELLGREAALYWDYITNFYDRFHQVPSAERFKGEFPGYIDAQVTDPVEAIIHSLKTERLGVVLDEEISQIATANARDPWAAKEALMLLVSRVMVEHQQEQVDAYAGGSINKLMERRRRVQEGLAATGVPWPWPYLNEAMGGMHPGHVYYLYGRPKSKKTWIMLYTAMNLWAQGLKVLFFTREMLIPELDERLACLVSDIPWWDIQAGKFGDADEEAIVATMESIRESQRLILTEQAGGIQGFKAKIEQYRPDVVMHDYLTALALDAVAENKKLNEYTATAKVIGDIKDMNNRHLKLPIILCGHANRTGEQSKGRSKTEHAGSDNIPKRTDLALFVDKDDSMSRIGLWINTSRHTQEGRGFTIDGFLNNRFGVQISEDAAWMHDVARTQAAAGKQDPGSPRGEPSMGFSAEDFSRRTRRV